LKINPTHQNFFFSSFFFLPLPSLTFLSLSPERQPTKKTNQKKKMFSSSSSFYSKKRLRDDAADADADAARKDRNTPLHVALLTEDWANVKNLVLDAEKAEYFNLPNRNMETPLYLFVKAYGKYGSSNNIKNKIKWLDGLDSDSDDDSNPTPPPSVDHPTLIETERRQIFFKLLESEKGTKNFVSKAMFATRDKFLIQTMLVEGKADPTYGPSITAFATEKYLELLKLCFSSSSSSSSSSSYSTTTMIEMPDIISALKSALDERGNLEVVKFLSEKISERGISISDAFKDKDMMEGYELRTAVTYYPEYILFLIEKHGLEFPKEALDFFLHKVRDVKLARVFMHQKAEPMMNGSYLYRFNEPVSVELVQAFIDHFGDNILSLSSSDKKLGRTPIFNSRLSLETVKFMVDHGALVLDVKDAKGNDPVSIRVKNPKYEYVLPNEECLEILKFLVERFGKKVITKHAFYEAFKNRSESGCDGCDGDGGGDIFDFFISVAPEMLDDSCLLHEMAYEGHYNSVKTLVEKYGASLKKRSSEMVLSNYSPLDYAVYKNHTHIVSYLLKMGAVENPLDKFPAFRIAVNGNSFGIAKMILYHDGGSGSDKSWWFFKADGAAYLLHELVKHNKKKMLMYLGASGIRGICSCSIDNNDDKDTLLHTAVKYCKGAKGEDIVEFLANECGFAQYKDVKNAKGESPIDIATRKRLDFVLFMLK